MSLVPYVMAGALAATRPEAAAVIQGDPRNLCARGAGFAQLISSHLAAAPGDERARELRTRRADTDWDQAVAHT